MLVVEYKGGQLLGPDDTREKAMVGSQWENCSGGRCLFLLATSPEVDADGRSLEQQVAQKIEQRS